jgi:hypothetical protein
MMNGWDSLWDEIEARGIPYDHHESDLYIPVTAETRELVSRYDKNRTATVFKSQTDGKMWFDIPFAYLPWWEKRTGRRNPGSGESRREMYAVVYLTGGVLDNLYLFDQRKDAEETYEGFLPGYDSPDDDLLLISLTEDSTGAFSIGRHLRVAAREKGFD